MLTLMQPTRRQNLSGPSHVRPYLPYEPSPLSDQDYDTAMANPQWEESIFLSIIE